MARLVSSCETEDPVECDFTMAVLETVLVT